METNNCVIIIKGFGYYNGPSEKYPDMFNISAFLLCGIEDAKRFSKEDAEIIKRRLEKAGYDIVIMEEQQIKDGKNIKARAEKKGVNKNA